MITDLLIKEIFLEEHARDELIELIKEPKSRRKLRQIYLIKTLLELGIKSEARIYRECAIILNGPLDNIEWKNDCFALIRLTKRLI